MALSVRQGRRAVQALMELSVLLGHKAKLVQLVYKDRLAKQECKATLGRLARKVWLEAPVLSAMSAQRVRKACKAKLGQQVRTASKVSKETQDRKATSDRLGRKVRKDLLVMLVQLVHKVKLEVLAAQGRRVSWVQRDLSVRKAWLVARDRQVMSVRQAHKVQPAKLVQPVHKATLVRRVRKERSALRVRLVNKVPLATLGHRVM